MSWLRPALNAWLRHTERAHLSKASDISLVRETFERKSRLFFHSPKSVTSNWITLADRPTLQLEPNHIADRDVLLYLHGGAYVFGSPRTHAALVSQICARADLRAYVPDYRKAPEDPFPAAFEDAVGAYVALCEQFGPTRRIFLGGDSAGGGLALSVLQHVLTEGLPKPAGLFAFSPLTDLTFSGRSIAQNAATDVILPAERVREMSDAYLAGQDPNLPNASPLYAAWHGAPPVWLCASDTEILLDDSRRITDRLQSAGVNVSLDIEKDLPHVWPIFHNILPEARATLSSLALWIRNQAQATGES